MLHLNRYTFSLRLVFASCVRCSLNQLLHWILSSCPFHVCCHFLLRLNDKTKFQMELHFRFIYNLIQCARSANVYDWCIPRYIYICSIILNCKQLVPENLIEKVSSHELCKMLHYTFPTEFLVSHWHNMKTTNFPTREYLLFVSFRIPYKILCYCC